MKKLLLLSLLIAGMVSLQATDTTPPFKHSSSTVIADQISSTGTAHNATITAPTPSYDLAIFFGTLIGAGILGTSLAAAIMYFRSKKHHTQPLINYQYPLLTLEEIIVASK